MGRKAQGQAVRMFSLVETGRCAMQPRWASAAAVVCALGLEALSPSPAFGDGFAPLLVSTARGQALVMPLGDAALGAASVGGLRVEVAVEDGFRVYRVRHRGRTHNARQPMQEQTRRLAFDFARRRLAEVAPTLLLRLGANDDLSAVIEAAGALGGKAYPALGWALLRLPLEANPAAVAQRLESTGLVNSARVQLRGPIYVPQ